MTHRVGDYVFSTTDAERTLSCLGELWIHIVHRRDPQVVAAHLDAVIALVGGLAEQMSFDLPSSAEIADAVGLAAVLGDLGGAAASQLTGDDDGGAGDALLEAAWLGLRSIAVSMADDELAGVVIDPGVLDQISISAGGVPKSAVQTAEVDRSGVHGDLHNSRIHHGRPWQALCLWSSEVIEHFVAAGHDLGPGAAGENLTIGGLDWDLVRPGVVLGIGQMRCEVSSYSVPCSKNARWFSGGDFDAMHHRHGPVSRVYATVIEPGPVTTGDAVLLGG
jgi:hypothetical protein